MSLEEHKPIGVIIVAHGAYGSAVLRVAESILGAQEDCVSISVDVAQNVEDVARRLRDAVERLNNGHGVIALTDMFGGTPTNLALSLLGKNKKDGECLEAEVVTGVNLPMLLKVMEMRTTLDLPDLAEQAATAAKAGIVVTGRMLRARKGDAARETRKNCAKDSDKKE